MARKPADAMARDYTEKAIGVLDQIMSDEFAKDSDRLHAANSMLDRGHGRPVNATIQLPMSKAQAARLVAMSDEELIAMVEQQPLPRLTHQPAPVDAEFTVAPGNDPLLD